MLRTVLTASRMKPPFLESIGRQVSLPQQALERERASNVCPEQRLQYIFGPGATMTADHKASSASVGMKERVEGGPDMRAVHNLLILEVNGGCGFDDDNGLGLTKTGASALLSSWRFSFFD
jgi:hypothetical protein